MRYIVKVYRRSRIMGVWVLFERTQGSHYLEQNGLILISKVGEFIVEPTRLTDI